MAWPSEYKVQTRERIVKAAADALRARGLSGVGVAQIMAAAGRTHGGFYAHFASKDELLRAAMEHADEQTLATLSRGFATIAPERRMDAVVDAYLSARHASHPERGCPVAALGPELVRADKSVKRRLRRAVRRRLGWLRALRPNQRRRAEDPAVGALACMVGGVILARAVGGRQSEEVLAACRRFIHRALEGPNGSGMRRARGSSRRRKMRARMDSGDVGR